MYDVVISVGPQHKEISLLTIESIIKYGHVRHVYVITNKQYFEFFSENLQGLENYIKLTNEEELVDGLSIGSMRQYIESRGCSSIRAGWYLQQFLKMSACKIPNISDNYLILDADTVYLKPVEFFDSHGRVFYIPETQNKLHKPYFETNERILGLKPAVEYSCMSECVMANKKFMSELIADVLQEEKNWNKWPFIVMANVETKYLEGAGFADYETYVHYVINKHPDNIRPRKLRHLRNSAKRFSMKPTKEDLFRLSLFYTYATFEVWNKQRKIRINFEHGLSIIIYSIARLIRYV